MESPGVPALLPDHVHWRLLRWSVYPFPFMADSARSGVRLGSPGWEQNFGLPGLANTSTVWDVVMLKKYPFEFTLNRMSCILSSSPARVKIQLRLLRTL